MPELTFTISVDDAETDSETIQEVLEGISDLEAGQLVNINVSDLKWTHPDWDWDKPCPECGSEEVFVTETDGSVYRLVNGHMEFFEKGEVSEVKALSVSCNEVSCLQWLYRGPASYVLE